MSLFYTVSFNDVDPLTQITCEILTVLQSFLRLVRVIIMSAFINNMNHDTFNYVCRTCIIAS